MGRISKHLSLACEAGAVYRLLLSGVSKSELEIQKELLTAAFGHDPPEAWRKPTRGVFSSVAFSWLFTFEGGIPSPRKPQSNIMFPSDPNLL